MMKQQYLCCFIAENSNLTPAFIQQNQIIELRKDLKKTSKAKIFATLKNDLSFSITKTQILQNKKYKFYIQLKLSHSKDKQRDVLNLIIDGKDDLQHYIKQLSCYGTLIGLQQMIVSCEKVGQGSFAQVYKVITNYDTIMALKAFDKKNLKVHKNKLAYENQVNVMRALKSQYIAAVEGIFQTEKNIYVKLEYFSFSLKHYLKKSISIKQQKYIMKQLFQALLQMKRKRIIHRDLKPQNIMIRGKNQKSMECVIIDFGLATPADLDKYIFNRCGTPGFLAPQIAKMSTKKDKLTPACDIFSLGCIFYKILSRKYIFTAANYNQVIQKNKAVDIPWDSFNHFSENQRNLISRMLQRDPSKRITPQQALKHSYFNEEIDDQDEIPHEECDLVKKMKSIYSTFTSLSNKKQSIQSMMSSFHTHSNVQDTITMSTAIQRKRFQIKDSCLSFQGPVKGSQLESKNTDFIRQPSMKTNRVKKRVSRFSQINQIPVL